MGQVCSGSSEERPKSGLLDVQSTGDESLLSSDGGDQSALAPGGSGGGAASGGIGGGSSGSNLQAAGDPSSSSFNSEAEDTARRRQKEAAEAALADAERRKRRELWIVNGAARGMVAVRSTRGSTGYYDQGFAGLLAQHLEQTTSFPDRLPLVLPPAPASVGEASSSEAEGPETDGAEANNNNNNTTTNNSSNNNSNNNNYSNTTSGRSSGRADHHHHHDRLLGPVFHARLEERTVLSMCALHHPDPIETPPHLCLLHQDSRGNQHLSTCVVDLRHSQVLTQASHSLLLHQPTSTSTLAAAAAAVRSRGGPSSSSANRDRTTTVPPNACEWLKKSRLDGGSSLVIPVPPRQSVAAAAAASSSASRATGSGNTGNNTGSSNSFGSSSSSVSGGVVVLGQRQITYCSRTHTKVLPIPQALLLSWDALPPDASGMPRFLLGDEHGNLHLLTLVTAAAASAFASTSASTSASASATNDPTRIVALQLDTLGSCTLTNCLQYLEHGLVFCGSTLGDSQLVQIHDEPIPLESDDDDDDDDDNNNNSSNHKYNDKYKYNDDSRMVTDGTESNSHTNNNYPLGETTFLSVVEEYTHLGPIVDFDLVPMAGSGGSGTNSSSTATSPSTSSLSAPGQSQVVTASGSCKSGSLRVIRNGIGMKEYASVELSGIQSMWNLRGSYDDTKDTYLVQSFVGETRVLGVLSGEEEEEQYGDADADANGVEDGTMDIAETPTDDAEASTSMLEDDQEEEDACDDDGVGGTLAEVLLPGLESGASTLHIGNVIGDYFVQVTDTQIRLATATATATSSSSYGVDSGSGAVLDTLVPERNITVAAGNEAGQVLVALAGGIVLYVCVEGGRLVQKASKQMDREVSCLDIHPFLPKGEDKTNITSTRTNNNNNDGGSTLSSMDISGNDDHPKASSSSSPLSLPKRTAHTAALCAVGLWDDFTVRLLSLESEHLSEALQIPLSTEEDAGDSTMVVEQDDAQGKRRNRNNMMARSLCLITLDFSSSGGGGGLASTVSGAAASSMSSSSLSLSQHNGVGSSPSSPGVNMLLVGLGDGTLVSFAVIQDSARVVRVKSKKEVGLGTQRIHLVPLQNQRGGNCVLATGDRPTVIYLAGMGGGSERANYNPKLCYSNVNLSPVDEGEPSDASNNNNNNNNANINNRPQGHECISVNVAAPFSSPLLFDDTGNEHYSLCIADDSNLRMGVIDDIQKLHVTTYKLGMSPRRIVRCPEGRMFAVGCIESGIKELGGIEADSATMAMASMGNCIRFLDDATFDDVHRIDLEPTEMVLSMVSASLSVKQPSLSKMVDSGDNAAGRGAGVNDETPIRPKSYLVVGTAYVLHDEDEPTKGRILVYSCHPEDGGMGDPGNNRSVRLVAEKQVRGGVYSISQFYDGTILAAVNSKTQLYRMASDGIGVVKLDPVGVGHHGQILSLFVSSRAPRGLVSAPSNDTSEKKAAGSSNSNKKEMLAIVGDLMRSISLVQYYPQYETLEEVARDFNANWTSAIAMLTDDVYLGGENWNNLFVLRRNTKAQSEEVRCRLDTVGEFHLGEMCNKFMSGSLVMPNSSTDASKASGSRSRRRALSSPKKKAPGESSANSKMSPSPSSSSSGARPKRPAVAIGSQTLFGTVDGTLGVILGLDGATAAFFSCLEKSMEKVIPPIGNFDHRQFRAFKAEQRQHPCHGFVDGDLVESFLDFDLSTMEKVVQQMNKDGSWTCGSKSRSSSSSSSSSALASSGNNNNNSNNGGDDDNDGSPQLCVDDVLAVIEEMTMLH